MNKTKDFHLKQFSIHGGHSGMAVSTDGILLGAWAKVSDHSSILDIGTGTGLLSLMCAQRTQASLITAIDIDEEAIKAAQYNVDSSPWSQRIRVIKTAAQQLDPKQRFEHIICNPPYFNSGVTSRWQSRATARHTHTLPHDELLIACARLLSPSGSASFILPKEEGEQFIHIALIQGWYLEHLCQVNTTKHKASYRLLFTLIRDKITCQHSQLTIHQETGYSDEFIQLTRDFYLKM
ncbi:tRNA1(Val) (adenine(37)-N6)-methyltransferase [Vibrio rumoiensis]|uniref:tRNA1(Val) (adenine(37)-N6)-methyltransferase n=1 Tax=Vibrio rumoiensis TaxID=76258 RepID=A0ABW7IVI9_9VIBR|nr:methyltransferase [Vibrio rumoiensis]